MQQPFTFDRASAERSLAEPDGALWPVNAYSDADELDSLVQAALDSGAIARANRRARLYIYPLSLCEPDPVLVYDPGHGRAYLGHALKLRDREDESPVEFTLRLLADVSAEAAGLAQDDPARPAVPPKPGEGPDDQRTGWPAEVRVDRPEQLDELVRLAADAEIGLAIYEEPPCTCSDVRGCPQCFDRAQTLIGATVRDRQSCEWVVTGVDEKDGFPTVCGEDRWAFLRDVEVVG